MSLRLQAWCHERVERESKKNFKGVLGKVGVPRGKGKEERGG